MASGRPREKILRERCKSCVYRASAFQSHGCNYNLITGYSRRCPASDCTKYKKGERIKIKGETL